ncbi:hypothetical protein BC941DRAFT_415922 [Chlamydoabsidia padenii]|nr:hypothetical protein BC941DRAFT_415922 [Chlamydoabsidia padenii]
MASFMPSSQVHTHTNTSLPSRPISPKQRPQRSLSTTPRKVDLELARLKQLGKVTKKNEEGQGEGQHEMTNTDCNTTNLSRHSSDNNMNNMDNGLNSTDPDTEEEKGQDLQKGQVILAQLYQQLEETRQQLDDRQVQINQLEQQHELKIQQLKDEHHQQIVDYQSQLLQQEKLAHETMTRYMGQYESSQLEVSQLTRLVEKQDQLIQAYMDQQQQQSPKDQNGVTTITITETEWHSLQQEKERLEAGIVALKANIETNQAHMQMMMMVSTEIQNEFEQQKVDMNKRMMVMANELAEKDTLLLQYQRQATLTPKPSMDLPSLSSPNQSHNTTGLPTPNISRYPSYVSSTSSTSSTSSKSSTSRSIESTSLPPLYPSSRTSVPPSSPPPVIPLPPIPSPKLPSSPTASTSTSSSSSVSSLKLQQHRYQQYQQQQQSRYFYQQQQQQQQKRQPDSISTTHRHDAPIVDPLISPTLRASSLDELHHNGKPFWKNMKNKWRTS